MAEIAANEAADPEFYAPPPAPRSRAVVDREVEEAFQALPKAAFEPTEEITLRSGGKARVWKALLWKDDLRRWQIIEAATPLGALDHIRASKQRELDIVNGIQEGPDAPIEITQDDIDQATAYLSEYRLAELAISVASWDNVRDPRTGEQLEFPKDLDRLSQWDGADLLNGSRIVLAKGLPDPNSTGDQSRSASSTAPTALIPNGPKSSRRRG